MSAAVPRLVEVRRLGDAKALYLRWDDGFESEPSYRLLCGFCPCAGCQGHGGKIEFHDPGDDAEPAGIAPVGNYAISITWKDGCSDGIYSFEYLRQLSGPRGADGLPEVRRRA